MPVSARSFLSDQQLPRSQLDLNRPSSHPTLNTLASSEERFSSHSELYYCYYNYYSYDYDSH